jgi:DNA-binding transcriptional regulator LsrR (DeoR family)
MTLQALGMHLDPQMIEGLTVLQLVGSMTTHFGYSSDIVSANIARALGADCVNLHAPAQVSSPEVAEVLRAEPVIAAQLVEVSRFNRAVFSAGSCAPGCHVVRSGLATEEDLADYVGRGARAVVFGRFIDGEGNEVDGPLAGRLIGVEPGRLRDAETRLLVSSRPGRGDAVRAALAGGFVTHLVLSRAMAEELAARPV